MGFQSWSKNSIDIWVALRHLHNAWKNSPSRLFVALDVQQTDSLLFRWPECDAQTALSLSEERWQVSPCLHAQIFQKTDFFSVFYEFKLSFSINLWFNTKHTMWATTDNMFSSKFMFAPNLCHASWSCTSNVQRLFQWGGGLFSQMWALSFEDRQTYAGLLCQGKMPASHYVELR